MDNTAQMISARALYNNSSDSPEELTFNQGDVLTVIQKDFSGVTGWWLCFLDGRVGLAPGNRLRILSHAGPDVDGVPIGTMQKPGPENGGGGGEEEESRDGQEEWKAKQQLNKALIIDDQQKPIDQQEIYDVPPSSLQISSRTIDRNHVNGNTGRDDVVYDVPPAQNDVTYDSPRGGHVTLPARGASVSKAAEQMHYQVPSTVRGVGARNGKRDVEAISSGNKSQTANSTTFSPGSAFGNVSETMRSSLPHGGANTMPNRTHTSILGNASATLPANIPGNLVENAPGNVPGKVIGNVRVCVEDDDDVSSVSSRDDVTRCPSPNTIAKEWQGRSSGQPLYDSISPMNQNLHFQQPETLQVFPPQQNRLHPSFQPTDRQQSWNQSWNKLGSSVTLPRLTVVGRAEDSRTPRSPAGPRNDEARNSAEVCVYRIPKLQNRSEYDRDSLLDEYSVPRGCQTLSPTRPHSASNLFSPPRLRHDAALSPKTAEAFRRSPNELETLGSAPRRARNESDQSEFQLSFVDTGIYVDGPQDPDSVADLMESLDRTVRSQVEKVRELCLGFDSATSTCRRREDDVSQLKLCCVSLRTAMKEVADLGTGVLASAMQLTSRDLSENILQQLEMLRSMSQDVGSAVDLVISTSRSGTPTGLTNRGSLRDALNSLMTLTQDIVSSLMTMTDLVGRNSAMICTQPKSLPPTQIPLAICGGGGGGGVQNFRSASPLNPLSQETLHNFRATSPFVMSPSSFPALGYSREFGAGSPIPPNAIQISGPGSVRGLQTPSPVNPLTNYHPVMKDMRSVSPIQPSSPTVSGVISGTPRTVIVSTTQYPSRLDPKPPIRDRPLPPLPSGEPVLPGAGDSAEMNAEDSDYAAIVSEAELELRRDACALVGRLADRSVVSAEGRARVKAEVSEPELLRPEVGSSTGRNVGGLSPQFKERLDALRTNTEKTMKLSCTRSRDASPSSSNPQAIQGYFSEFLVGIDHEIVHFYADQVRGHFAAVDSATRDFLFAVGEGRVNGSELAVLSRTVVLAAHKLVYASDAITKKLMGDEELRRQVGVIASDLCLRLRETVVASKSAAADVGLGCDQREQMLNCMREVKYLSMRLRDVIFAHMMEKIY